MKCRSRAQGHGKDLRPSNEQIHAVIKKDSCKVGVYRDTFFLAHVLKIFWLYSAYKKFSKPE